MRLAAPQRGGRITLVALALVATVLSSWALRPAATEAAGPTFDFGFADDRNSDNLFTNEDASVRNKWLGRVKGTGARYARINVYWSSVAPSKPAVPANPNDPAYNWTEVDRAVRSADAQGLEIILLGLNAPSWAEAPGRPKSVRPGAWKPDPAALQAFAKALATRYSGSFLPVNTAGVLPKVSLYEAWNEPNLRNYLAPLWNGRKPNAPKLYRGLLNAFYAGVKSASSGNRVITGGTSPFGDPPGGRRMHPLQFWREVFCLSKKLKKQCSAKANFDIFGHNAINSPGDGPSKNALHPDDATPADMKDLAKVLRAAERAGTAPGGKHDFWSTETWYESPPERQALSLKGQAAAMVEAMYIMWKAGASNVIWLQIRDSPYDPKLHPLLGFQTGVYFINGKPKPSVQALRFPFLGDRKQGSRTTLWGIAPASGKLTIEAKAKGKGGYRQIASKSVTAGRVFKLTDKVKGKKVKLRAKIGAKKSLAWNLK